MRTRKTVTYLRSNRSSISTKITVQSSYLPVHFLLKNINPNLLTFDIPFTISIVIICVDAQRETQTISLHPNNISLKN